MVKYYSYLKGSFFGGKRDLYICTYTFVAFVFIVMYFQTEEEIQTLRQVLASKVKNAQDLKRRLGITVWREFTEDFNNSMKSVRESQT